MLLSQLPGSHTEGGAGPSSVSASGLFQASLESQGWTWSNGPAESFPVIFRCFLAHPGISVCLSSSALNLLRITRLRPVFLRSWKTAEVLKPRIPARWKSHESAKPVHSEFESQSIITMFCPCILLPTLMAWALVQQACAWAGDRVGKATYAA